MFLRDRRTSTRPTTADFIATAERASGEELSAFFDAWLYGTTRPPLPGG